MDPFKTPGAFSWNELVTSDPAKAAEFYSALFGWDVKLPEEKMAGYRVVNVGGQGIAGIMSMPPDAPPMPSQWGSYITVSDTDQTIEKCKSLGGTCCMGPMDIPGVGRMAVLQDPQGAMVSVIAYSMPAS